jgi:hypothetical protein
MFFAIPIYSSDTSQIAMEKSLQIQESNETTNKKESSDAFTEGILYSIGVFVGEKIIWPILIAIWEIIVLIFVSLGAWVLPIIGIVIVLFLGF